MSFSLKEQPEYCFDGFNFFGNYFRLAVSSFSVAKPMGVLISDSAVFESHLVSERYVFAYRFAFRLCEAAVQGKYELALRRQRIYILFLEYNADSEAFQKSYIVKAVNSIS